MKMGPQNPGMREGPKTSMLTPMAAGARPRPTGVRKKPRKFRLERYAVAIFILLWASFVSAATYAERMRGLWDSTQAAIQYYTVQDNSCRAPQGIFPARLCETGEVRRASLKDRIEHTVMDSRNAAQRAYNRYMKSRTKKNSLALDAAIIKARADLDALEIPR